MPPVCAGIHPRSLNYAGFISQLMDNAHRCFSSHAALPHSPRSDPRTVPSLQKHTYFTYHIVFILFSSIIPTFRRFIRQQRPTEQYDENHIVPHMTPKKTGRGKKTAYKDKPIILLTITKDCILRTEPCGRDFARNMRRVTCNSAHAGEIMGKTILLKEEQRQGAGSVQSEVRGTESAASYMKRERERERDYLSSSMREDRLFSL